MKGHVNRGWLRAMIRAGFAKERKGTAWVPAKLGEVDMFKRGRAYRSADGIVHHAVDGTTVDYMVRGAK
jgi:hypothetical protein